MHALVSALDWGFGHTTRSVAVIHSLQTKGYTISIACTLSQKEFYLQYFPTVKYYPLPYLNFQYSTYTSLSILLQFPKLFQCLKQDRKITKEILLNEPGIDLIVSDNRYGFRHKDIKSVLVCHQLNIILPKALAWIKPLFNIFYNRLLNKFSEIWIPDFEFPDDLSRKLSKIPMKIENKCTRIGILSRFQIYTSGEIETETDIDYLFLISGIEKQRTIFENKILEYIKKLPPESRYLIVRGLPSDTSESPPPNCVNHLNDKSFIEVVKRSKTIIARAGYSTVMDLVYLKKTAILVPTPGQTEQEYLAEYLTGKYGFEMVRQKDLLNIPIPKRNNM